MKRTITIITACLLATAVLNAQTYEWAKSIGGMFEDEGNSISIDASGNVYTTGYFQGTVDFDPGEGTFNLTSAGDKDIFVQKMDNSGNFVWAKNFGGPSADEGNSISIDASGNIYTTGYFHGTVDFDPGAGMFTLTSAGINDIFVQKMDNSGNFIWAKSIGGTSYDYANSLSIDASGNVYTIGYFQGTVDFDPGEGTFNLTSPGGNISFVLKLDASGNFLWAKAFEGTGNANDHLITTDDSGNVYATGYFQGTADFDPGIDTYNLTSLGDYDVYVLKLDESGNFLWAKSFGGVNQEYATSINIDPSGNIYTTGSFVGTADFDPGDGTYNLTSVSSYDIFVQKMDASGNFLWAKSFGGTNADYGISVNTDATGNVYTSGVFMETADFDPGEGTVNFTSAGYFDIFVHKMDASGNLLWVKTFGGTIFDVSSSVNIDASGNVYTTGYFQETVDFDPGEGTDNLTSAGFNDIFVQKISQCLQTTGTDVITACDSYTWIDGITYTSSNNTATYTLSNAAGCDSIVTLDLTINTVDVSLTDNSPTLIANAAGANYQWLDCDNGYAVITGENNQSFTATANGNYAVEITENGCTDTSACVSISVVGIIENNFGNQLIIYPNPSNGNFKVDLGKVYENTTVLITNLNGKSVYSDVFTRTQTVNISIEEVPAGVYLLSIHNREKKAIIKLIKE